MVAKFFPDILPAVEQYEAGLSLATIAQHLGVNPSSVYYRLRNENTNATGWS